jgi:hypothetical protein
MATNVSGSNATQVRTNTLLLKRSLCQSGQDNPKANVEI